MRFFTQPLHLADLLSVWHAIEWRNWLNWPRPALIVLAFFCAALGAMAVWLGGFQEAVEPTSLASRRLSLQSQLEAKQSLLTGLKTKQTNMPPQDVQHDWPTLDQSTQAVMGLYAQAQSHGLQVDSFKPDAPQAEGELHSRAVAIRLHGRFAQVASWSEDLFHQAALWRPEKWILTGRPAGEVTLDAVFYLYLRSSVMTSASPAPSSSVVLASPSGSRASVRTDPFGTSLSPSVEFSEASDPRRDVPPLRQWPLQKIQMVGSFVRADLPHALVQTPSGLFSLAVGDLLGAEHGVVLEIEAPALRVRVREQQVNGSWGYRLHVLPLQVSAKK